MPILPQEPSLYPPELLDADIPAGANGERNDWWLFHTRPRQEKCLARDLAKRDIAFYLPLVHRRIIIRSKTVRSYVPLFPGYVFGYGGNDDRERALMTNRVSQVIGCGNGERLKSDLRNIQRLIEANAPLTIEARIQPNQWVRIRSGPLEGLEGVVIRRKNQVRLVVWVTMLGRGASVEIDDFLIEPLA